MFADAIVRRLVAALSIVARKARTKAEADFATWLMMAKLGGFDDLPPNAQGSLINYRTRLETIHETESTALAVHEVYGAYYSEMEAPGRRRNQKPTAQRQKPKSCGFRDGLNLSPNYRLRAIRRGRGQRCENPFRHS